MAAARPSGIVRITEPSEPDGSPEGDDPTVRPPAPPGRAAAMPGPEVVAAILSVVVIVGGLLGANLSLGPAIEPSASPSATAAPVATVDPLDRAAIDLAIVINGQLAGAGDDLALLAAEEPVDTGSMQGVLRAMNVELRTGLDVAGRIAAAPGSRAVGADLRAYYTSLGRLIDDALRNSLRNEAGYRAASLAVVAALEDLPALQRRLQGLLRSPAPTPATSPDTSPDTSPHTSPSAEPTPAATDGEPSVDPGTTDAPPSMSAEPAPSVEPVTGDQLRDGDFEGDLTAWRVLIGPGASATLSTSLDDPASGARAARVAVGSPAGGISTVTVVQDGLRIQFGGRYVARVFARAEQPREVRLRVVSPFGAAYAERTFTVGTTWSELRIEFATLATDADARFELNLGGSDVDVWLDAAAFGTSN